MEELKPLEEKPEGYIVTPGGPDEFPDNILHGIHCYFASWICKIFQMKLNLYLFHFVHLELIQRHY